MRKSVNMIEDAAVPMITGIENIELFLEENDKWQFHFSGISDIHWDDKERRLDVSVHPTYCVGMKYDWKLEAPVLDLHFIGVRDFKLDYIDGGYVDEISMKVCGGFLDTWFDCYMLHVTSKSLVADKPRIVPRLKE